MDNGVIAMGGADAAREAQGPLSVRVLHLIPQDGVGGVEIAAKAATASAPDNIRVHFLSQRRGALSWAPRAIRAALEVHRSFPADVVVFSLWKSLPAFLAFCTLRPRTKRVLFVHSAQPHHPIDWAATATMRLLADEVWADSGATLAGRSDGSGRVISFLPRRLHARERRAKPHFIYWGRLAREKHLSLALEIVARISASHCDVRLDLIGRDDGEEANVRRRVEQLNLTAQVRFHGERPFEDIVAISREASFYLQTSQYEGMALSVVEAMQLGLVPIVTPVGEIANYCTHNHNSLLIGSADQAAAAIEVLLQDEHNYRRIAEAAAGRWRDTALYHHDVLSAARALMRQPVPAPCAG